MSITQILESLAISQPHAPALHVPGRASLSYADLGAQIRYVRERLGGWDIDRGDIVVGVVPLRPEMALACATLPAAATFAPLSPTLTADVYCELLARLRPKALLLPRHLDHPVRLAAQCCGVAEIEVVADPSAPAGLFTLALARRPSSVTRAGSAQSDCAYLLATSGTTGRPKFVPYSHARVASIAQRLSECLRLTPNDIGCHLVPMHHSHGLAAALMVPLLRGSSVVCLPESDIDGFFTALGGYPLTWFTGVFSVHREILRRARDFPEAVAKNKLRCMRASAGRLDPAEIDRIEATFGAPLLIGFGMSEATPITHETLTPRRCKRGSVGQAASGQVAIMNEAGAICATSTVGEVVVRGPLVFDGYFDDEQATAAAFVDAWFRTGDLGHFDDDGYLFLRGRKKDMINRGGEKISPAEIDSAIEAIPGVRAAATFGIPHQSLGEEVVAAVVREGDATIEVADIIDRVRQRMGPTRVPRRIYFVNQLPRTDSGKVRRSELPHLLGLVPADASTADGSTVESPAPASSALESALIGLWSSVLQVSSIGVKDDFFLLGGDSLRGARLLIDVKAVFAVDLVLESLFTNASTVAGMARAIEAARRQEMNHE